MVYFVAVDGDDVGPQLRCHLIRNELDELAKFSTDITAYFNYLGARFKEQGYELVFCGGDSLLCFGEREPEAAFFVDFNQGPCTLSIGIAHTAEHAYLALQLAKARGKRQVVTMTQNNADTIYVWT